VERHSENIQIVDDEAKEVNPEKSRKRSQISAEAPLEVFEGGEPQIAQTSNSSRYFTVEYVKERIDRCLEELADVRTHVNKQAENLEELKIKY
jgi:hypothetical protein